MRVDFSQNASDHGKVNVLLCPVGEQLSESFLSWIEHSIVNCIKNYSSNSKYGKVALRVLRSAPKQSDELWGDYLYHRRLHGVIGISNGRDIEQVGRVADVFGALAASYPRALHSCLVVTAPNASEMVRTLVAQDPPSWPVIVPIDTESDVWEQRTVPTSQLDGLLFQSFLDEFCASMRDGLLEVCRDYGDCRSEGVLLRAPPEMHGAAVDDTRSANRKKRCMGRLMKQKGDLLMLAGETVPAVAWYTDAYDVLKGINDYLWMGGALLGYSCALHRLTLQAEYAAACGDKLNPHVGDLASSPAHDDMMEKAAEDHRRSPSPGLTSDSRMLDSRKKMLSPNVSPLPSRRESLARSSDGTSGSTGASSSGTMLRGSSSSVTNIHGILVRCIMMSDNWAKRKAPVSVDGGVREAIIQFTKVDGTALFEAEVSMLLVRLLVELKRNNEAATLLTETMSVDYGLDFSEKLVLLISSGKLFRTMGFERKAAFAFRLAALQRVRSSRPSSTAWKEAYMLLSNCLEGFGLQNSLPRFVSGHHFGWHRLQCCMLRELSFLAHRSGNGVLAISHSLVLLHAHHMHMSEKEVTELIKQLNEMTHQIRGQNQQMRLEVLPEWMLNKLPKVRSFYPVCLPQHLLPLPIVEKVDSGPFIFSSLRNTGEIPLEEEVVWVQGSSAEVSVELTNPLSCEIRIEKMALLTEGAQFEAVPTSISLAPQNEPYNCVLIGIPQEVGNVTLLGYVANFYEVEHTVKVKVTGGFSRNIRVVPQLPFLTVRNLLDSPDVVRRTGSFAVPSQTVSPLAMSPLIRVRDTVSDTSPLFKRSNSSTFPNKNSGMALVPMSASSTGIPTHSTSENHSPSLVTGGTVLRKKKGGMQHSVYSVELNLHPGQGSSVSLVMANRGERPIQSIRFICEERPSPPDEDDILPVVEWNEDTVAASLPLESKKSLMVPANVQLHRWHQTLGSGLHSSGTGVLTCQCQILYTGVEGQAAGLQRSCHVEFKIHVLPILELHDLDAKPVLGSPEKFLLAFSATNSSESSLVLSTRWGGNTIVPSSAEETEIEPLASSRVNLQVPRIKLEQSTSLQGKRMDLAQQYMAYLSSNVAMEWRNSFDTVGSYYFAGERLVVRPHMLHNLQPEAIVYGILVDGATGQQFDDLSLMTPVTVEVTVTNESDAPLGRVLLQLRFHETLGNGYIDTELAGKCAVTGSTSVSLPKLSPKEAFSFTSEVTLFSHGKYSMYVRTVNDDFPAVAAAAVAANPPARQPLTNAQSGTSSLTAISSSHTVLLCSTPPQAVS